MSMFTKLEEVVDRFREIEGLLSDPALIANQEKFRALTKEHADLSEIVEVYGKYCKVCEDIEGNRELLREPDEELKAMAKAELPELEERKETLTRELQLLLVPKDPNDGKNIFLEVRAGTGGDE
ncbi:MAG: PCRF domain-containing protein, partial [Desulfuromonadaceae bacterium]